METNKIQRKWCNNGKCSECTEGCRFDEIIHCTPDCENLTDDGRIKIGDCISSGCDAALSVFGYTDRKEMECSCINI